MRVGFRAARGAPGTTTLALAVAAEMNMRTPGTLAVEADPHGGTLAALLSLPATPSVIEFGTAGPAINEGSELEATHDLGGGLRLLTAPCSARQAAAAWTAARVRFEAGMRAFPGNVVIDHGRHPGNPPDPNAEERQVWVVRPTLPELASLVAALREGDEPDPELRVVAIVQQPPSTGRGLHPREVHEVLTPFARLVEIPWDVNAVTAMINDPGRFAWRRSRFGTAVGSLTSELVSTPEAAQHRTQPTDERDLVEVMSR